VDAINENKILIFILLFVVFLFAEDIDLAKLFLGSFCVGGIYCLIRNKLN